MAIRGRRNRRFAVEDCTVEYRKHAALAFLAGHPKVSPLIDLSVSGLQFVSEDLFDIGQRLDLKVILPGAFRALITRAEVVWAKRITDRTSYRMGVRFLNPSAEDVALLRSLEERHWAVPDERKRELEATIARRFPLHLEPRPPGEPARVYDEAAEAAAPPPSEAAPSGETPLPAPEEAPPAEAPAPAPTPSPIPKLPEQAALPPAPAKEEPPALKEAPKEQPAPPPPPPPAPAPPAPEETPPPPPLASIPLYDLVAGIEARADAGLLVRGVSKGQLILPGITDRDAFAMEVHDNTMRHTGAPSFDRGDVVVFSPNVPARSGDLAFVVTREGGAFRQVFFDANNVVRLRALNSWYPEQCFNRGEVQGLWRLIAKAESYLGKEAR